MKMNTSLNFELINAVKNKHNCIYKKTHRSRSCPMRMYDVNGKIDNCVTRRAEFELLCR